MSLLGLDIYLRSTDKDGSVSLTEHRVWDAELFMSARARDVAKVGGQSKVERITRDDYLAAQPKRSRA